MDLLPSILPDNRGSDKRKDDTQKQRKATRGRSSLTDRVPVDTREILRSEASRLACRDSTTDSNAEW